MQENVVQSMAAGHTHPRPVWYAKLKDELRSEDQSGFRNYLRMTPAVFEDLLRLIGRYIHRSGCNVRALLPAGLRLAVTLRHLATGACYHDLMYNFRVAHNTLSGVIRQVCRAIYEELSGEYLQCPTTVQQWLDVDVEFKSRWNFEHCLGAIDGKHMRIKAPKKTGSLFYSLC